jgi:hypothetical protein
MVWALVIVFLLALMACAPIEPQRLPPEIRIEYRSYPVDRPVPCFTEAERPRLEPPTPIDLDTADVSQKAKALAADMENERLFAAEVDRLFEICMKRIADGTATQPVGVKP